MVNPILLLSLRNTSMRAEPEPGMRDVDDPLRRLVEARHSDTLRPQREGNALRTSRLCSQGSRRVPSRRWLELGWRSLRVAQRQWFRRWRAGTAMTKDTTKEAAVAAEAAFG